MADDYTERMKFIELADEADRAKLVWLKSYLEIGRFSTAYMREANILSDAVEHARMHLKKGTEPDVVIAKLAEGLQAASKVRLDSVMPDPLCEEDLNNQRKAFMWMAEMEDMDTTLVAGGKFFDRKTQRAWIGFQAGYKLAMTARNLAARAAPAPVAEAKPDRKKFLS